MKHYLKNIDSHEFNVEEYESAWEVFDANQKRPVAPQWQGRELTEKRVREETEFFGVKNKEEAYEMLRKGWSENVDKVAMNLNKAMAVSAPKRVAFRNDVVGFAPIVPLAMMNVPTSMINNALKPVKQKVVRIMYVMSDSCGTSVKTFLNRGQEVMKAILSVEQSGYRCELYAMQTYTVGSKTDVLLMKIKEASQPLDIKRVMFPLTHPAMFRVIGFEWQDRFPTSTYDSGRGRPFRCVSNHEKMFKEAFGKECVYLDGEIVDNGKEAIEKRLRGEIV